MKPDGVTMETTEPTETAAAAEPSSLQDNVTEQARSRQEEGAKDAARRAAPKANGKSRTTEPKVKPKATVTKSQSTTKSAGVSGSFSRPTTASHRTVNNAKSSDNTSAAAGKKLTTTAAKASLAGAVPKRPMSVAAVSTAAKSQTRMPDKKSVAPPRTTSFGAPTATNGTKLTSVNGTIGKRPPTETVNVARSKTTATTSRTVASNSSKPSTSTTSKAVGATTSKTTRPATALSASRPTATTSRSTATTKPSTTATTAKTTVSRVNTAPSTGRSTAAPPPRTTAAKKDVSRPVSTAVAKKPTAATASAATKKTETSKPTATVKVDSASKWSLSTKAADTKLSQTKPQQPPAKKPVAVERVRADNKLPVGQPPSASSANKPANGAASKTKRGAKPTQAVPPFTATKKANVSKATAQCATGTRTLAPTAAAVAATTATLADARGDATVPSPLGSFHAASTSEDLSAPVLAQDAIPEVLGPARVLMEPTPLTSAPLPAENAVLQVIPPTNLNEDEEEKECSPLVSVSEMSGTTQPTEESRPGSAGLVGGSVWRAGGPLLSELDSEEVSGSQQGASELSAPGVLEGTESMDDLGDGSLKGAIDMEGASAGSPDFEKVPDIPVNDFDEDDDEDDDDRVCDMDVGSERADEPQRPRHDNDVDDDDDDDDVEMASEGVTESGLESYGNADEDDFAEDERLDNLNRLAQPPPPPPMLPSAPAAQWDQPNPFANPWAEPIDQGLHAMQGARAAVTSPLANPWQADSETPTQSPAQAWLELGSAPLVPENQEIPQYSSVKGEAQNLAVPMSIDQISPAPVQTLTSGTPGMSLSSTLSSETSTPEELGDYNREGNLQPQAPLEGAPQPDLAVQLDRGEGEGEEEADTLPADDVLGGPATAPTSNPSSPSVTEDEASDTEGEAQLGDSLETQRLIDVTFDCQPSTRRCLSTVEEAEEPEMASTAGEDTSLLSASFVVTYGFDATITASNSNAQSAGESCIKSPGIFSLEELPEEAKESGFIPPPSTHLAEQQYIERGKQEVETAEHGKEEVLGSEEAPIPSSTLCTLQQPEENTDAIQAPYYSAICEKTEDSFAGFTTIPHPHRRDHSAHPGAYYYNDVVVKAPAHSAAGAPPRLTCADLPPRNLGRQALSPQLRRLEQHQRQLLELQQRREQRHRPLEEEEERKRREEEEEQKKKDEAEEEIKRNKREELKQRHELELQLQQQQEELKQRQQIMQWQQELQQSNKGQTALLSPSSGLCTIYEALENSDEEEGVNELNPVETEEKVEPRREGTSCERLTSHEDSLLCDSPPPLPGSPRSSSDPSQDGDTPDSPERPPPPLELDWGKKVDIVQQLINQTLLLNRDGCSSLMLLPGGAGGTLSPLESSLWPSLLPPLTPPSATVTSVSSFSPEAAGSSPQGEWTVVELETHH